MNLTPLDGHNLVYWATSAFWSGAYRALQNFGLKLLGQSAPLNRPQ